MSASIGELLKQRREELSRLIKIGKSIYDDAIKQKVNSQVIWQLSTCIAKLEEVLALIDSGKDLSAPENLKRLEEINELVQHGIFYHGKVEVV